MVGLSLPASSAPAAPFIGITFRRVGLTGGHTGLAWREPKGALRVFHQRAHLALALDDAPHASDAVVRLKIPTRDAPTYTPGVANISVVLG